MVGVREGGAAEADKGTVQERESAAVDQTEEISPVTRSALPPARLSAAPAATVRALRSSLTSEPRLVTAAWYESWIVSAAVVICGPLRRARSRAVGSSNALATRTAW